eukprot:8800558-Ditylum_brightwellii.AAC.1
MGIPAVCKYRVVTRCFIAIVDSELLSCTQHQFMLCCIFVADDKCISKKTIIMARTKRKVVEKGPARHKRNKATDPIDNKD